MRPDGAKELSDYPTTVVGQKSLELGLATASFKLLILHWMTLSMHRADRIYLCVTKIRTFAGEKPLTNATGFFYLHEGFLYLVTSRHVVLHEASQHRPDHLQLSLHSDQSDPRQRAEVSIPLYKDEIPQWYQHPERTDVVDVVAIAVNDPHVMRDHAVTTFTQDDILDSRSALPLGQNVLILGFPLGFHDTVHNLPIVRNAIIASSYSHPFKGDPYFLTDARLHRGMSGSPVIAKLLGDDEGKSPQARRWRLLGVHSSSLDVSDRDPHQDEKLALNTTWYASLLAEIIPAHISTCNDVLR